MSAYGACLDLALGLGSPALGMIASGVGLDAVFLIGALTALCGTVVALRLGSTPAVA